MRRWLPFRRSRAAPDVEVVQTISRVGQLVSSELELPKLVQVVTDAATQLTGAAFGAFFYNVTDSAGERYTLYALSGAPRSAFEKFPMPRKEIGSVLIAPLRVGASVPGAVAFGRAARGAYADVDRVVAEDLAGRIALALQNAQLYRDAQEARATAERAGWQAALLAEASRLLTSSLDYDASLDALIRLAVPTLADWAVVHLALRDGRMRRIGPAYADPALAPLAEMVRRVAPPRLAGIASAAADVVRGTQPLLISDVSREWLETAIEDAAYREVVLRLDPRSVMVVPLVARGRTVGSMTFVSLKAARRRENGRASLVVSDTGPGIPADVLPLVFDRFRQADSSSTRRHGGLGLGLAIVKHLVELHGGTVRAENATPARGAVFTIELPTVA